MENERRKHERHKKFLGIRYTSPGAAEKLSMTQDISQGGMAFLSENPLSIEQKLEVEILRGEDVPPVPAELTVLRHFPGRDCQVIAGKFTKIRNEDEESLGAFLEKYEN